MLTDLLQMCCIEIFRYDGYTSVTFWCYSNSCLQNDCNMSDQLYNNKHVYKHVDTMSWHGGVMAKASY